MSNELKPLEASDVPDVLKEIEEAFFDIPFENSAFQNRAFVVAAQQTPARAFRAVGLRMFSKIQAVREHLYNEEKIEIDLEEKRELLQTPDLNKFEKRRIELEIRRIEDNRSYGKKLFNDALRDLDCMYAEFKKLPRYTREQFEDEEMQHFQVRLQRQLTAGGAHESILNMTEDLPQFEQRILKAIARRDDPRHLENKEIQSQAKNGLAPTGIPRKMPMY